MQEERRSECIRKLEVEVMLANIALSNLPSDQWETWLDLEQRMERVSESVLEMPTGSLVSCETATSWVEDIELALRFIQSLESADFMGKEAVLLGLLRPLKQMSEQCHIMDRPN